MLSRYKSWAEKKSACLLKLFKKMKLTPNHITSIGFASGVIAAFLSFYNLAYGLVLFCMSFLFDIFDGAMARTYKMQTNFGAFYDSVMDRIVELLFIAVIAIISQHETYGMFMIGLSTLISYSKHRADTLVKEKIKTSIFDRAERMIFLILTVIWFMLGNDIEIFLQVFLLLTIMAVIQITAKVRENEVR